MLARTHAACVLSVHAGRACMHACVRVCRTAPRRVPRSGAGMMWRGAAWRGQVCTPGTHTWHARPRAHPDACMHAGPARMHHRMYARPACTCTRPARKTSTHARMDRQTDACMQARTHARTCARMHARPAHMHAWYGTTRIAQHTRTSGTHARPACTAQHGMHAYHARSHTRHANNAFSMHAHPRTITHAKKHGMARHGTAWHGIPARHATPHHVMPQHDSHAH